MSEKILETVDALGRAFDEFKKSNDARLSEIAKKGSADPLLVEKVEKANAHISDLQKQLDELAKKQNRPGQGGGASEQDALKAEHRKAFDGFVRKGITDGLEELQVKAMSIGSNADGGFAIPPDLDRNIAAVQTNVTPMRQLATVISVSNQQYSKLVNIHGVAGGWVAETAARPETASSQLASISPSWGEVYANPSATQRVLDDAFFDVEGFLASEIGIQFGLLENTAFTAGSGTNQPKGFLAYTIAASPTFGQIKQVKSGVAGQFATDKLFDVVHSLKARYRPDAAWQAATLTVAALRKLKDTTGRYLWEPSMQAGAPSKLLGYDLYENEDMPALATAANCLAFGNWKAGYIIADVRGTRMLRDPYTNKPSVMFYTTKRVGGALLDSNAIVVHTTDV